MASAAFLRRLASLTEFLARNKAMGRFLGHEDAWRVADKAIEQMVGEIQKLTDADLPDKVKVKLHYIVNQRTDDGGCVDATSQTGERTSQQKHNFVHNFFTAGEWKILHTGGLGLRIKNLLKRCALIGLLRPSEATMVLIVSIWSCPTATC